MVFWCRGRDSNPHGVFLQRILSPSCLAIPPPRQKLEGTARIALASTPYLFLRPRRELHSRITLLQRVALLLGYVAIKKNRVCVTIRTQFFYILLHFFSFFNCSKISSILPASLVFLSSKNLILGSGLIFNL